MELKALPLNLQRAENFVNSRVLDPTASEQRVYFISRLDSDVSPRGWQRFCHNYSRFCVCKKYHQTSGSRRLLFPIDHTAFCKNIHNLKFNTSSHMIFFHYISNWLCKSKYSHFVISNMCTHCSYFIHILWVSIHGLRLNEFP